MKKLSLLMGLLFLSSGAAFGCGKDSADRSKPTALASKDTARAAAYVACGVTSWHVFWGVNKHLHTSVKEEDSIPLACLKHGANFGGYIVSGIFAGTAGALVAMGVVAGLHPALLQQPEKKSSEEEYKPASDR